MKKSVFLFVLSFLLSAALLAQEGMWLLNQIDQLGLEKKGLKIATSEIYSKDKPALYNAVVQIGGGTGSFVSPDGLIITNHHVAFGAFNVPRRLKPITCRTGLRPRAEKMKSRRRATAFSCSMK